VRRLRFRQFDLDGEPALRTVPRADNAAVQRRRPLRDGESEPRAFACGYPLAGALDAPEGDENSLQLAGRNAGAFVFDQDVKRPLCLRNAEEGDSHLPSVLPCCVLRGVAERVADDIFHSAPKKRLVCVEQRSFGEVRFDPLP